MRSRTIVAALAAPLMAAGALMLGAGSASAAAGTGLRDGLVLRAANNGPWQQWYPMADGTLSNAATHLAISPNGTGAQLRGTVHRAGMWVGSAYTWIDYAHLPR